MRHLQIQQGQHLLQHRFSCLHHHHAYTPHGLHLIVVLLHGERLVDVPFLSFVAYEELLEQSVGFTKTEHH